ncbi:cupin domain-containing protein [Microlunatus sp. GCM10028923]|uniref:cupin domain-containing protein n=1 Tax=Microlunatus sp. GCM10028923 TaxID=3273400 RepID=UPI00361040CE
MITVATAGTRRISGGSVRMPPGGASRTHHHPDSDIIVAVVSGRAATIVWHDGEPEVLPHTVDEMCYVPAGLPHCAVNLSLSEPVLALEFRTDPEFNADVALLPNLEDQARALVEELRASPVF